MVEEDKSVVNSQYRSIESKYRRDVAIINARPKLETGLFVFWAVLDAILLLVFIFGVIFYITSGMFTDARQSASILRNVDSIHASVVRTAPAPLDAAEAKTASIEAGKYDFHVNLENYNHDWYPTFDYSFVYSGGQTESLSGFLNPQEKRTFATINVPVMNRPSSVRFVLSNLVWHRVDRHVIKDISTYIADRANITVESATYARDLTLGEEQIARSQITLKNQTAYAFWEPEFLVKLMRGTTVVSLTKITVPEFKAGEVRSMEVRWFGEAPPSATVVVEAMIPYFDRQVFMNPDGESGQDVRL